MTVPHRVLLAAWLVASLPACAEASGASPGTGAPPPSAASANAADHETYFSPAPPTVDAKTSPCPWGMAQIERYCIDSYEAHLISRGADGEATPHPYFERPEEGVTYEARSEAGVYPQAYVSRIEAKAACVNAGKRLCSLAEWQRACKGEAGTTYPYGARWQSARCNTDKRHLLTLRFGADTMRWGYAQFNDPSLDQEPGFLAKTGEYEDCVSDAGVHDLVGNLHEWVSDTAGATLKARLDSDGISRAFQYWSPGNGVVSIHRPDLAWRRSRARSAVDIAGAIFEHIDLHSPEQERRSPTSSRALLLRSLRGRSDRRARHRSSQDASVHLREVKGVRRGRRSVLHDS